ncbi:MAG: hypothetical protein V4858_00545 [Pseudomonadota bacterium]
MINCEADEQMLAIGDTAGLGFEITYKFEEPACPVFIACYAMGDRLYGAALRVGVHNSQDWESVDLGEKHVLVFKCYV